MNITSQASWFAGLAILVGCLVTVGCSPESDNEESAAGTSSTGGSAGSGGVANSGGAAGSGSSTDITSIVGGTASGGSASSSSGSASGGSCEITPEQLCGASSDYSVRCGHSTEESSAFNKTQCVAKMRRIPLNCAFVTEMTRCLSEPTCVKSDDVCIAQGFLAAQPAGWDTAALKECREKPNADKAVCEAAVGGATRQCLNRLEECIGGPYEGSTEAPFVDDKCFSLAALVPSAVESAVQCLALPCDQIGSCLRTAGTFSY